MSETNTVSPLRQRMIEDMAARKLNPHTQRSHIYSCKRFTAWLKRSPDTATADEVRRFQLHLVEDGASICNRNRIMTGVRFLFRVTPKALTVETPLANAQAISDFLATLQPKTDAQKAALATANQYASMVVQSRLLIALQVASGPVSWFLIAILVFWTAALFFGIGLYAEPNGLVYAALAFGGLSIAFAIFMIFEFGLPYTGLFRVPPAALEQAIEYMNK